MQVVSFTHVGLADQFGSHLAITAVNTCAYTYLHVAYTHSHGVTLSSLIPLCRSHRHPMFPRDHILPPSVEQLAGAQSPCYSRSELLIDPSHISCTHVGISGQIAVDECFLHKYFRLELMLISTWRILSRKSEAFKRKKNGGYELIIPSV